MARAGTDDQKLRREPDWLRWARRVQAIAQSGLAFSQDKFDRERYGQLRELAAEIMAAGAAADAGRILELFNAESGYATPKVEVRGAVFRSGRILMVREIADGLWTLPGGFADVDDAPSTCVVREIEEESGFVTRAVKLAGIFDRRRHPHWPPHPFHIYKLFFVCEIVGGAPRPSIETSEVAFFDEHDLPELSAGRVLPFQVRRMFEHWRAPALPADFD